MYRGFWRRWSALVETPLNSKPSYSLVVISCQIRLPGSVEIPFLICRPGRGRPGRLPFQDIRCISCVVPPTVTGVARTVLSPPRCNFGVENGFLEKYFQFVLLCRYYYHAPCEDCITLASLRWYARCLLSWSVLRRGWCALCCALMIAESAFSAPSDGNRVRLLGQGVYQLVNGGC